jgi:spermidine synthase
MDAPYITSSCWFSEEQTPNFVTQLRLNGMHYEKKSPFQTVQVITTEQFGKSLVLDGKTQSVQFDEFVYHESLVQPSMLLANEPKKVFIGGGGELATAREVLRNLSVERVVMVDLDKDVVDVSIEMLPEWGQGVQDNPKLEIHYEDAMAYLENTDEIFDVIIMDIADPIEAGPGYVLYTTEFYEYAITKLTPGGILVTQSGPGALHNARECFAAINKTLNRVFDVVLPYTVDIASFGSDWAFNMAFNITDTSRSVEEVVRSQIMRSPEETDSLIEERIEGGAGALRFYDGLTHLGMFSLSKAVRAQIEAEDRVITKDSPIYMF